MKHNTSRLAFVASALTLFGALWATGASAAVYDLTVDKVTIKNGDYSKSGIGYNGSSPGPVMRFTEGEDVTINVTNNLKETTSIHWHGLIVPYEMDGVPGISFDGIAPGETFSYKFPVVQSGSYWYHSHSGFQEPDGAYGAIVITPKKRDPFRFDKDYVVQLTDEHEDSGATIMRNLKMMDDYYNRTQRTLGDFFTDVSDKGFSGAIKDRVAWGKMRMTPTDVEDVQGFTTLINGKSADQNWTGLFKPGERIRLRLINSSAMTYYDIRIPGLEMTVVAADGNNVQPIKVDELRISVAETYDVIVRPTEDRAYTIFAESMGRTGFGVGTLAPREGMRAEVPEMREPPLLTMADMGMDMAGMKMGGMDMGNMDMSKSDDMAKMDMSKMDMSKSDDMAEMDMSKMDMSKSDDMAKMDMSKMDMSKSDDMAEMDMDKMDMSKSDDMAEMDMSKMDMSKSDDMAEMDMSKMDMSKSDDMAKMDMSKMDMSKSDDMAKMDMTKMNMANMKGDAKADPFYANGSGLTPVAANGGKFLSYADLKAQKPLYEDREATREIEVRLTGNMTRYSWSINGVKYEDSEPIRLQYGERVRFKFVNETMMTHPMHLHGMWSILDTGNGKYNPVKHTISIAPGTTVYSETEVDAPGQWAFHCHLSYHAAAGMFRMVVVEGGPDDVAATASANGGES